MFIWEIVDFLCYIPTVWGAQLLHLLSLDIDAYFWTVWLQIVSTFQVFHYSRLHIISWETLTYVCMIFKIADLTLGLQRASKIKIYILNFMSNINSKTIYILFHIGRFFLTEVFIILTQ